MRLFDDIIQDVRAYVASRGSDRAVREVTAGGSWPAGKRGNVVLRSDTAVELGSPEDESVAVLLWTSQASLVQDGRITLVGPDVVESGSGHLPFGKLVILATTDVTDDTCAERHRELDLLRFDLNLAGYMMRAMSQQGREWSRVSRQATAQGFSLCTLGSGLIRLYRSLPYVTAAEILFVTSSSEDVRALRPLGERAARHIAALNKVATERWRECDVCDFSDVCNEVESLRAERSAAGEQNRHA